MSRRVVLICFFVVAGPASTSAQPAPNVVTDWAAIVQQSVHDATAMRSAGRSQVLQRMVLLAMYNAAVAVEGGYEPYGAG